MMFTQSFEKNAGPIGKAIEAVNLPNRKTKFLRKKLYRSIRNGRNLLRNDNITRSRPTNETAWAHTGLLTASKPVTGANVVADVPRRGTSKKWVVDSYNKDTKKRVTMHGGVKNGSKDKVKIYIDRKK